MRDIKFRAWNKKQKFMDTVWSIDWEHGKVCHRSHNQSELDDCVLMQYTELKDKNGTEIYEGDITTNELYENEGLAFVVYYDNEDGMFEQQPFFFKDNGKKLGNKNLALQMDSVGNKKIIGNIYENPELLEV